MVYEEKEEVPKVHIYCRVSLKTWRVIDNPALNMHSPLSPPLKGVKGT